MLRKSKSEPAVYRNGMAQTNGEDLPDVADAPDNVNHPAHYTYGSLEVIDAIEGLLLPYHLGNAVKYIARVGRKGWCCERGDKPCGKFVIRSRLVEPALLKAYETVDLDAVKEKQKDKKYKEDAKLLFSMKKKTPVFESVDYWWVDDLIDHIEFGKHSMDARELMRMKALGNEAGDDRVMKVFWRCGVVTTVSSGALTERDDPVKVARMHGRMVERKRKKKEEAEAV